MSGNLNPVLLQCFLIRTKNLITILSRNRWEPPPRKTSETFGILPPFFKIFKIYCGLIFEDSTQLQSFKGLQVNKGNSRGLITKFVELTWLLHYHWKLLTSNFHESFSNIVNEGILQGGSPVILPWWVKHKPQLHCCSLSTLFPCSNTRRMFSLMTSVRL